MKINMITEVVWPQGLKRQSSPKDTKVETEIHQETAQP